MRSQYWSFFFTVKYQLIYTLKYHEHARRVSNFLSIVSAVTSSAAIAGWLIWEQYPWAWSVILAVSQLFAIVKPFLPYSERMSCLRFLIPELKKLVMNVEMQWNRLGNCSDDQIAKQLEGYRKSFVRLDAKYLGTLVLPTLGRLEAACWEECRRYMRTYEGGFEYVSPSVPKSASG